MTIYNRNISRSLTLLAVVLLTSFAAAAQVVKGEARATYPSTARVDGNTVHIQKGDVVTYEVTLDNNVTTINRVVLNELPSIAVISRDNYEFADHKLRFEYTYDTERTYSSRYIAVEVQGEEQQWRYTIPQTLVVDPDITLTITANQEWGVLSDNHILLTANVSTGNEGWNFRWHTGATTPTLDYAPHNGGSDVQNAGVSVTATRQSDNFTLEASYSIKVYPQPQIIGDAVLTSSASVVFSGATVRYTAPQVSGGNSEGWEYSWTNAGAVAGNPAEAESRLYNESSGRIDYDAAVRIRNVGPDGSVWFNQEFTTNVTAWPQPTARLDCNYDELFDGMPINASIITTGGDPEAWGYFWRLDGGDLQDDKDCTITTSNSDANGTKHDLSAYASNAPEGINEKYNWNYTHTFTSYPAPVFGGQTGELSAFSGQEFVLWGQAEGGKPGGWQYEWTCDGEQIRNDSEWLTTSLVNNGLQPVEHTFRLTVTNRNASYGLVHEYVFPVIIYPEPKVVLPDVATEIIKNERIEIPLSVSGGAPNAWSYIWRIGDATQPETGSTFAFTPTTRGRYTVTAEVINSPSLIYSPYNETFTFDFTVYDEPTLAVEGNGSNDVITCDGRNTRMAVRGVGSGTWTYQWYEGAAEIAGETNRDINVVLDNPGTDPITKTYRVVAHYKGGETPYEQVFNVTIYPRPNVVQENSVVNVYYDRNVYLNVEPSGGNPAGWDYTWYIDGSVVSNSQKDLEYSAGINNKRTCIVEVFVRNRGNGEEWYKQKKFSFTVNRYTTGSVNFTEPYLDYNGFISQTLSASPVEGYPDGWTFEWTKDGEFVGTGQNMHVEYENNTDYAYSTVYEVRAKNAIGDDIGYNHSHAYKIYVWPKITTPDEIRVVKASDMQEVDAIVSGDQIVASVTPATGGYNYYSPSNNRNAWTYDWTVSGSYTGYDNTSTEIYTTLSRPYSEEMSYGDVTIRAQISNTAAYQQETWFDRIYEKTIQVYNAPLTPRELVRKGDGTTGTLIVLAGGGFNDDRLRELSYEFVFGYTDRNSGQMYDMPATEERFYRFGPSELNDYNKRFYVYAQWRYNDGSVVKSGLRYLDGYSDDNYGFNNSILGGGGRGDNSGVGSIGVGEISISSRGFAAELSEPASASVSVRTTSGQLVFSRSYAAAMSFDEAFDHDFVPGIYIVTVQTGASVETKKIVIR